MAVRKNAYSITRLVLASILLIAIGYVIYSEFFLEKEVVAANVGSVAPDFTVNNLDGIEQALSDYRSKGVVLNFWATYCPPCEKEMPLLEKTYQAYKDGGIEVVAVDVAEPTPIVNHFVTQKKLTFPILLDREGLVAENYQVQNLPITFFINSNGEIVEKVSGELTEEKLKQGIELINHKLRGS